MAYVIQSKLMQRVDIPAFVDAVTATGCDIRAIGSNRYVIGDHNLDADSLVMLAEICKMFGDRDFLAFEICQYLRLIGRGFEDDEME